MHCNDDVPGIERFIQHNYADGSYKCFAYNSSRLVGAGRHDVCCHTCTHTNIHVQTTTHTHTHKHIHTHTHTRIHTHAHIHIHTQTHTRTNNQTHTRTHIHIHTYTHTHTHTHTQTSCTGGRWQTGCTASTRRHLAASGCPAVTPDQPLGLRCTGTVYLQQASFAH